MQDSPQRTVKTIRLKEDIYYQARVASVMSRKSMGQWLEEAIVEKLVREPHPKSPQPGGEAHGRRKGVGQR